MSNIVRPKPHNVKIIRPNKNLQQKVANQTIEQLLCKRCGRIKSREKELGDHCLTCSQLLAYKREKEIRDNENSPDVGGVRLVSQNAMTDNDFMSWVTQTQKKPFISNPIKL